MNKKKYYDLFSCGLLLFIAIVQIGRWPLLPQFIDGYFHLHQAQGFLKAGGWVPVAFWDYAPFGRVNIYPPFYHLLIASFLKAGLGGVLSLKIVAVSAGLVFFLVVWYVLRKLWGSFFAFFSLLILFSSFSFYASLCANLPATLALIFVFLSFFFLQKNHLRKAIFFAALAFYTHTAISFAFFLSLVFMGFFGRRYIVTAFVSFLLFLPFGLFQLKYLKYFSPRPLYEVYFLHFNPLLLLMAFAGVFFAFKQRKYLWPLFFSLALIAVFWRYFYRLFSAQGIVAFALLSAVAFDYIRNFFSHKVFARIFLKSAFVFFLLFNSSFVRQGKEIKFYPFYASLVQFLSGGFSSFLEFQAIAKPSYFGKVAKVIKAHTASSDILGSNIPIANVILGALSERSITSSMLVEVLPFKRPSLSQANFIVWFRKMDDKSGVLSVKEKALCQKVFYQDDISFACRTPAGTSARAVPAKIRFFYLYLAFLLLFLFGFLPLPNKLTSPFNTI